MMRKSWRLGIMLGIGLFVQATGSRADGWRHGCVNCGSTYYGGYSGYAYYGAPAYSYGYAPQSYFAYSYGYPTGYSGGTYSSYGWSYPYYGNYPYTLSFPGTYGYGIGYPNYYSWGYYQPYAAGYYTAPTYYRSPTSFYY